MLPFQKLNLTQDICISYIELVGLKFDSSVPISNNRKIKQETGMPTEAAGHDMPVDLILLLLDRVSLPP
jgi:hypothetical protein